MKLTPFVVFGPEVCPTELAEAERLGAAVERARADLQAGAGSLGALEAAQDAHRAALAHAQAVFEAAWPDFERKAVADARAGGLVPS